MGLVATQLLEVQYQSFYGAAELKYLQTWTCCLSVYTFVCNVNVLVDPCNPYETFAVTFYEVFRSYRRQITLALIVS